MELHQSKYTLYDTKLCLQNGGVVLCPSEWCHNEHFLVVSSSSALAWFFVAEAEAKVQQQLGDLQAEVSDLQSKLYEADTRERMTRAKLENAEHEVCLMRIYFRTELRKRDFIVKAWLNCEHCLVVRCY